MNEVSKKAAYRLPLKLPFVLILLAQIPWLNVASAAQIDCEAIPHTRLESAICGDPALRALDNELSGVLQRAVESGFVVPAQAAELRNGVAKQCWRETGVILPACLLNAELHVFDWVTDQLDKPRSLAGTQRSIASRGSSPLLAQSGEWRSTDPVNRRIAQLQKQLAVAERSFRQTGSTDLVVATIAGLLDSLEERGVAASAHESYNAAVANLMQRVHLGCDNPRYKRQWRASLRQHNLGCTQQLPLSASSDFN